MLKYLSRFLTFINGTFIAAYISSLFSEDYKKYLSWWPYVVDIILFLSLLLLLIKILQQNKQINYVKSQKNELEKEIKKINEEHKKNLQGQIESKSRVRQERDDYRTINQQLQTINVQLKEANGYQKAINTRLISLLPPEILIHEATTKIFIDEIDSHNSIES
ncbi:hypothetical protein J6K67_06230 [Leuconostoc mesenteroides]|uniref:hypothetical protein n=1 Tax=Leuconostoc mesenteroides TaxID=1245 RepID=UPI001CC1B922|nr:hypothetical protein [Leuconostoc mesenteroides]MBZ1540892.1 hypothetical protein [Leuconostoc mesenteroides]